MQRGVNLLPDDLDERSFAPSTIKFTIENLLPGTEVQFALGDGDHDFTPHYLPFEVRVRVILPCSVVLVL